MFVRHAEALERFRSAIERTDLETALEAAGEMRQVALYDALELCRLFALSGDARFDRAATRWLLRLEGETDAGLDQVHLAASAFSALGRSPESEDAWNTLRGIVRAK
jgi:hypothetical protein